MGVKSRGQENRPLVPCPLGVIITLFLVAFIDKSQLSSPPTLEEAEKYFEENRKDLEIVADFLINESNDVYIMHYAHRWENWKNTELTNDVRKAIERLRNGQYKICITKDEDTIGITIWFPAVLEMSSGFIYSINGKEPPVVQFATTLKPLSEPGWYFYIEDFNTWRLQQRGQGEQGDVVPSRPCEKGTVCVNPTEK